MKKSEKLPFSFAETDKKNAPESIFMTKKPYFYRQISKPYSI